VSAPCLLTSVARCPPPARLLASRYKLRRPVTLDDTGAELAAWQLWGGGGDGAAVPGPGWSPDPRLRSLGWRGVFAGGGGPPPLLGGAAAAAAELGAFRALRYSLGVPEGDAELGGGGERGGSPAELGLDGLAGVSYAKGCYVGQERTAHAHYRGVIRRRLMPATLEAEGGGEGGAEALRAAAAAGCAAAAAGPGGEAGEVVGAVRAAQGAAVLAHLKLAPALAAEAGSLRLRLMPPAGAAGPPVWLRPFRPAWWPPEWSRLEGDGSA